MLVVSGDETTVTARRQALYRADLAEVGVVSIRAQTYRRRFSIFSTFPVVSVYGKRGAVDQRLGPTLPRLVNIQGLCCRDSGYERLESEVRYAISELV